MSDAVAVWLARAIADAKARNLPELEPLLETLARSLRSLRDADRDFAHPALPVPGPQAAVRDPDE